MGTNYLSLAISILIQALLLPFLLHRIGAEATGVYTVFMTISNFASVGIGWLSGAGITLLASAHASSGSERAQSVHWVVLLGFMAYGTLFLLLTVAGAATAGHSWLAHSSPEVVSQARRACVLLGVFFWVNYVHQADISLFIAVLQQGWANIYRVVSQVVFGLVTLAVVRYAPRLDYLMAANIAGAAVAAITARVHLRRTGALAPVRWRTPDPDVVRQVFLTIGGSYFIFGVAQFALLYGDVLLIGGILGPVQVAKYVVLWKIPEVASTLLGRISELLTPYLTRRASVSGPEGVRDFFLVTDRAQHLLGIASGFLYAVYGPLAVRLWVGAANAPTQRWLYWVAGAVLAMLVMNRHDVILHFALARIQRMVPMLFCELALKWLLVLVLFSRTGVGAPLVAQLIIQVGGMTWWYRHLSIRLTNTSWARWRAEVGRPAALLAVCLFPLAFLAIDVVPGDLRPQLAYGVVMFAVGLTLLVRVARISETHQLMREFFRLA